MTFLFVLLNTRVIFGFLSTMRNDEASPDFAPIFKNTKKLQILLTLQSF